MLRSLSLAARAHESRDLAGRVRRLADSAAQTDRIRLLRHAEELEAQAERWEREARGEHAGATVRLVPSPSG